MKDGVDPVYPEWKDEYRGYLARGMFFCMGGAYALYKTFRAPEEGLLGLVVLSLFITYCFGRRRWIRRATYTVASTTPAQTEVRFVRRWNKYKAILREDATSEIKLDEPARRFKTVKINPNPCPAFAYRDSQTRELVAIETPEGLWRVHAGDSLKRCMSNFPWSKDNFASASFAAQTEKQPIGPPFKRAFAHPEEPAPATPGGRILAYVKPLLLVPLIIIAAFLAMFGITAGVLSLMSKQELSPEMKLAAYAEPYVSSSPPIAKLGGAVADITIVWRDDQMVCAVCISDPEGLLANHLLPSRGGFFTITWLNQNNQPVEQLKIPFSNLSAAKKNNQTAFTSVCQMKCKLAKYEEVYRARGSWELSWMVQN
jgi:hypothetical protein